MGHFAFPCICSGDVSHSDTLAFTGIPIFHCALYSSAFACKAFIETAAWPRKLSSRLY